MTKFAFAIARAFAALLSYSCGSAFGSETILSTCVWVPPSCDTRLPQKFSAATTCTWVELAWDTGRLKYNPAADATTRNTARTAAMRYLLCIPYVSMSCEPNSGGRRLLSIRQTLLTFASNVAYQILN